MSGIPQEPMAEQDPRTRLEREAWFRAQLTWENLELRKAVSLLRAADATSRDTVRARDTEIHRLHQEALALRAQLRRAHDDLGWYAGRFGAASEALDRTRGKLNALTRSWTWALAQLLWSVEKRLRGVRPPAALDKAQSPPAPLPYFMHTSPYQVARGDTVELRGWVWPEGGRLAQVRARVGGSAYPASPLVEDADATAQLGLPPGSRAGFHLVFPRPATRTWLSLEAQREGGDWNSFLTTWIWPEEYKP